MTKRVWIRLIALLVVIVLALVIIIQNTAAASVQILFFRPSIPLALLLLITFLLGYAGGIVTILYLSSRKAGK